MPVCPASRLRCVLGLFCRLLEVRERRKRSLLELSPVIDARARRLERAARLGSAAPPTAPPAVSY